MEFSLDAFMNSLVSYMAVSFPYMEDEELDRSKHPKRNPLHLKDAVFNNLYPFHSQNSITFDIGNENLERTHPYYHILEDTQVIRKRGKSTKKTRGSQALVEDVGKRDYGRVKWNGKTYTKEYTRNVRGSRSLVQSSSRWVDNVFVNREANYYNNIHFRYIENMLNNGILDQLAQDFNLKRLRTQNTGLSDEFALQENQDVGIDNALNLANILNSFSEE